MQVDVAWHPCITGDGNDPDVAAARIESMIMIRLAIRFDVKSDLRCSSDLGNHLVKIGVCGDLAVCMVY